MVGIVEERGYVTKDLPFLDNDSRDVITSILSVTQNYWDFSQNLSKRTTEPDIAPDLVYLSLYHSSRLVNSNAIRRTMDAHPELPIIYPFFLSGSNKYNEDAEVIEDIIGLTHNLAIRFYMLMRLYRVSDYGSPEEERVKNRIEDYLAKNKQLRLHGADYLGHTGFRLKSLGQIDDSYEYLTQALELARESGDKWHQATLLTLIAEVTSQYRKTPDSYAIARKYLGEAMEICKSINDRAGVATILTNMSVFAISRAELGEAIDCQLEAVLIGGELGSLDSIKVYNLSMYYAHIGDGKNSLEWAKTIAELDYDLGPYQHMAFACAYTALGQFKKAEQHLDISKELTLRQGLESGLGQWYQMSGRLERKRGDFESAMDNYVRALDIHERLDRQVRLRSCLMDLAEVEVEMFSPTRNNRDDEHSGPWMKRYQEEIEKNDIPGHYAYLLFLKSELRIKQGRHEEGEDLLDSVIELANRSATRFLHKTAVDTKSKWVEDGVLPLDATARPRNR
jgi:tetratricopeptide (TPR) repeat protein